MTATPLVCVLMTVYNRENYISQAIESVLKSSYQHWELIIVDDRSKDNSEEIVKIDETKDSRIKVKVNEKKNLGAIPIQTMLLPTLEGIYKF